MLMLMWSSRPISAFVFPFATVRSTPSSRSGLTHRFAMSSQTTLCQQGRTAALRDTPDVKVVLSGLGIAMLFVFAHVDMAEKLGSLAMDLQRKENDESSSVHAVRRA